ncbi:MAG: beta-ketoacyl synthase N-terminal-like domain-containing protein, partial [bacterium]|nr:beta-ketoacyl synthase N-terminal-like domain-containing protein [bacterium]
DKIISSGETGISYGSSSGSLDAIMDFYSMSVNGEVKNLNSGSYLKMMPQTTTVNLSVYFKTTGRLIPTSTACTSGSMAIGAAYEAIKNGQQTVMIAGGAEEYHPTQVAVFDTLYATSAKNDTPKLTPSPFDKNRDGLVIGEGAGTLILEEYEHAKARGAKIYAEIIGYSTNTDGTHITNPNSETMAIVMK